MSRYSWAPPEILVGCLALAVVSMVTLARRPRPFGPGTIGLLSGLFGLVMILSGVVAIERGGQGYGTNSSYTWFLVGLGAVSALSMGVSLWVGTRG